jgi:hypothetical protein
MAANNARRTKRKLNENDVDDDEPPVAKYAMPGEKHNN